MTDQSFSGALATWREINLSELQKTLDAQGIEIVDNQKESLVGRKALADKTKEFKKIPDEDKLSAFKGLLKAYQTEIDNLTKRAKTSESAFLNVYKVLAEAVDPYPFLEAAVDQTVKASQVADLEKELRKARDENAELRKRSSDLSNAEALRKKAEAKTEQLEQKMEEMIQERITQKENEFNATYDEKLRNYEDREQDLRRQLSLTKNQLRDLRMSDESNQAKLNFGIDQEVVEKLAEVDMIVADLERANSRVAALERRNEMLRAEAETMRGDTESSERVKSLNAQVANLDAETERISRVLDTQKAVTAEMETSLRKKIDVISKDLQRKVAEVDQLKQRLKQYNDYDEIKRELDIMKYVEFAGFEDDTEDDQSSIEGYEVGIQLPNPNADKANVQQGKPLETLLATKNKRLLEELTKLRILHGELEASLHYAQGQLDSTSAELEKQKDLNEKLENDLLSLNKPSGNITPSRSSEILVGLELGARESSARSTPVPFASSADNTILPIVTSQRDRFRQRNAELEEELRKQFHALSELRAEMKNLQSDNLKLYEKVRYMQSYREESSGRAVTSQLDPLPAPAGGADDMSTYHARYEANINPFEAFRGREATRAIQNLNPIERGVLILTRTILGNRRARTFFIFYTSTLHLLVMYTVYELSTSGSQLRIQPYSP
ncbi:CASP C terminal-domain-containing protein [Lentinula aciculospora]|uniref:Protein CASP n=1 Tax=Lentinula aciculospora TaxID=153920 RepID=A0A9W9AHZ6_9AGAR|nr:CASP C terminal-domain-containing protein [Lentinula aciculospora]